MIETVKIDYFFNWNSSDLTNEGKETIENIKKFLKQENKKAYLDMQIPDSPLSFERCNIFLKELGGFDNFFLFHPTLVKSDNSLKKLSMNNYCFVRSPNKIQLIHN